MTEPLAIVGPPGTGKTHYLMEIVEDRIRNLDYDPSKIGFFSFTRKAAEEARDRAARNLGLDVKQMHHFRTLHSLAFRQLGLSTKDVINASDFKTLEKALGVEFQSTMSMKLEDGEFFRIGRDGDFYLTAYNLARVKGTDPMREFGRVQEQNHRLSLGQYRLVINAYNTYRQKNKRIDFVDMIEMFVDQQLSPQFDLLIVDEAQDLVPLQWKMIDAMAECAKEVVYAGDDDQCIYSWMGVDLRDIINSSENKMVLDKSYRLPRNVYDIAESLINRVVVRQPKVWSPVSEAGQVVWHHDIMDLNFSSGEWLILARTNYIANKIATDLKEQGYLFWREGSGWSISPNVLTGIEVWLKLCKGLTATAMELKTLSTLLRSDIVTKSGRKNLATLDNEIPYALDDVKENFCTSDLREKPWYEVLKVAEQERIYITSVRRMGEKILTDKPRVKISTIHKAKGGEADNVALVLDTSRACAESRDQDSEIRTFYVGMTRAKKALHLIEKQTRYGFVV